MKVNIYDSWMEIPEESDLELTYFYDGKSITMPRHYAVKFAKIIVALEGPTNDIRNA